MIDPDFSDETNLMLERICDKKELLHSAFEFKYGKGRFMELVICHSAPFDITDLIVSIQDLKKHIVFESNYLIISQQTYYYASKHNDTGKTKKVEFQSFYNVSKKEIGVEIMFYEDKKVLYREQLYNKLFYNDDNEEHLIIPSGVLLYKIVNTFVKESNKLCDSIKGLIYGLMKDNQLPQLEKYILASMVTFTSIYKVNLEFRQIELNEKEEKKRLEKEKEERKKAKKEAEIEARKEYLANLKKQNEEKLKTQQEIIDLTKEAEEMRLKEKEEKEMERIRQQREQEKAEKLERHRLAQERKKAKKSGK